MTDKHGTLYVDNSTLKAVAACPTQALLRYGLGYCSRGERIAADCGTAVHEALALWLRGEPNAVVMAKLEALWREPSERLIPDDPKHYSFPRRWNNLAIIMDEWLEQHRIEDVMWEPTPARMIEVGFQVPLGTMCVCGTEERRHDSYCAPHDKSDDRQFRPRFLFTGRLDAVVTATHDGARYVLDHKTTSRLGAGFVDRYRNDSQMSGYPWAVAQTFGEPVAGILINAIELKKVPDSNRKCTTHGVPYAECGRFHCQSDTIIYQRSPWQLEEWERNALVLAEQWRTLLGGVSGIDVTDATQVVEAISDTRTTGTFNGSCYWCDFKDFCPAGKPAQYLGSMLEHHPWQPFELPEDMKTA